MIAEIISVGTEILMGEIVDTNSRDIALLLRQLGIVVYHIDTVGDNPKRLKEMIEIATNRSDIVITTGGLGPTSDDITTKTVAEAFDLELVEDKESLRRLENYFSSQGIVFTKNNLKQVYFPKDSKVLINENGTADAFMLEKNGKMICVLPGPPFECIPIFKDQIIPIIEKKSDLYFAYRQLNMTGLGESKMEDIVKDLIENQSNPTIGTYFKESHVQIRLTASADTEKSAEDLIRPLEEEIIKRMGDSYFGNGDDISVSKVVCEFLLSKNLTISTAESLTGGMLASKLVDFPGISKVFSEGFVCYSDGAKAESLGVDRKILEKHGAVSKEVAEAMAEGAAKKSGSDIGISTTGIAGPDGGSEETPVGTVYIGLYYKEEKSHIKLQIGQRPRNYVRIKTVNTALDYIRRKVILGRG